MGVLIILVVAIIILVIVFLSSLDIKLNIDNERKNDYEVTDLISDELFCDILYDDVKRMIEESNFCETDEDCKVLSLDEIQVDSKCYHLIHKEVNESVFYTKVSDYMKRCIEITDDCEHLLIPACVNERCVFQDEN